MRRQMVLTLCLFVTAGSWCAADESESRAADALAVVSTQTVRGHSVGNGFFVGDGSVVVTARHTVAELSTTGDHRAFGLVSVISPYLGDVCQADVVATDDEFDIAVLRVPWQGHPALTLADERNVLSSQELVAVALPVMDPAFLLQAAEEAPATIGARTQTSTVAFLRYRKGTSSLIELAEAGEIGPGWSGSPALIPRSACVAGCLTDVKWQETHGERARTGARGSSASQIRRLVHEVGLEQALGPFERTLPRPDDGLEAFRTYLRAISDYNGERYPQAREGGQRFSEMRPRNALGYRLAARAAEKAGDREQAETFYRRALDADPEAGLTRMLYAQFLQGRGKLDEARALLEPAWQSGSLRTHIAIALYNVLTQTGEFSRCTEIIEEALEEDQRNAHLWVYLGQAQLRQGDYDTPVASFSRAHALLPEENAYRLLLAQALSNAGKLEEAEGHLKALLAEEPENPTFRLILAQTLERAGRVDEAEGLLRELLKVQPANLPLRVSLARVLERAGKLEEAEEQLRRAVELQPGHAVTHFTLAVFLSRHRPDAKEEALQEARLALELPPVPGLPRSAIQKLMQDLQSQKEQEPQPTSDSADDASPPPAEVPRGEQAE